MKVDGAKELPDVLERVKFTCMAWTHDGKGMFYNSYPQQDGKSDGMWTLQGCTLYETMWLLMTEKEAHLIDIACLTFSKCSSIAVHKYMQSSYQAYSLKFSHCSLLYIWLHSLTPCGPRCSGSREAAGRLVIVIGLKRPCLIAAILLFLFNLILFYFLVRYVKVSQTIVEGFMIDINSSCCASCQRSLESECP